MILDKGVYFIYDNGSDAERFCRVVEPMEGAKHRYIVVECLFDFRDCSYGESIFVVGVHDKTQVVEINSISEQKKKRFLEAVLSGAPF